MTELTTVGQVTELWRYPLVGSMGEPVEELMLDESGVDGDRAFGAWDVAAGHFVDVDTVPELRMTRTRMHSGSAVTMLADGTEGEVGAAATDRALSEWLQRSIELRRMPTQASGPARILSLPSLAAMARRYPEGQWDVRRMQPHIVVVTPAVEFAEDGWVGSTIRAGGLDLAVRRPTGCREDWGLRQVGLAADEEIVATITDGHGATLGADLDALASGSVRLADLVSLLDA